MTKVLVVEDEQDIRVLLVDNLFDFGYDVIESRNGSEAVKMASQELPDLILLDVMLPVMDGFKVLKILREDPITEAIPVVMVTAVGASDGEKRAMELGVRHYISKPFEPDTLRATIRVALREAGATADYEDDSVKAWGGSTYYRKEVDGIDTTKKIPLGEKLFTLEKILEGGIRVGSFTILEGQSATGKSIICQYVTSAALQSGHGVAYFTSQYTFGSLGTQVNSIGLDLGKYFHAEKLRVYPLEEPTTGKDSGPLLAALAAEMEHTRRAQDVIVVDAITDLASSCQEQSIISFFTLCRRLCARGKTIVLVTHSSAFSADLLGRVCGLCETHLSLRTGKIKDKVVRTVEVLKVDDVDLTMNNAISFNVESEIGINVIPYSRAKA